MPDFSKLYNLYWYIRVMRNKSIKRRYYRYAAAEKKRLIKSGVDAEELRLLCRSLASRWNIHAKKHLETYRRKMTQNSELACNNRQSNCR
jgi:hypothetical protein